MVAVHDMVLSRFIIFWIVTYNQTITVEPWPNHMILILFRTDTNHPFNIFKCTYLIRVWIIKWVSSHFFPLETKGLYTHNRP